MRYVPRSIRLTALFSLLLLLLTACGGPTQPAASPAKFKLAMILPGTVQDSDYNFVGNQALNDVKAMHGIDVKYQENVAPADAERVARGFINDGYNIVAFHGGQFVTVVQKLAPEFKDVNFIMESSGKTDGLPGNVWNIGRKFYEGFYALGAEAALVTKSGKIGIVLGTKLPDFVAAVNAIKAAVQQNNPKAQVVYTFVGDQNDPVKARQAADAQVGSGVDFIIMVVNLGAQGVIESVKDKPVLITTYYTDKTSLAPKNFAGSLTTDFGTVYKNVVGEIIKGNHSGYNEMRPGNGFGLAALNNVPADVATKVKGIFDDVAARKIQVQEKTDVIVE